MCGIAGCVAPSGTAPDRAALERAAAALKHRGPDDAGVEVVGSVGLVHTRLAIVDPTPAGHQPMRHPGGRWWITYNGEVFNHLELRRDMSGVAWRGGSDTETVLHALEHFGEGVVARCNGLYAYAALDLDRGRLLLVRDRFGVKPLYVARHGGALWFASEIGALLAAGVPARPVPELVRRAVTTGWVNGSATPLAGVDRVLPGTLVSVDLDSLASEVRTWYDPADVVEVGRVKELAGISPGDAAREVGEALRVSVRRRLMADVPVGTMCSGGVDSSLVAAFAAQEHPRIVAFNASVVDQPEHDEGPFAERVATHLGIELRTVRLDSEAWRAGLVSVVRHIEYPLTHESSVPMMRIAELARDGGVKVLMSGEGADELFGGYSWLHPRDFADFVARRQPLERLARAAYRRLQGLRGGADPADDYERAVSGRTHAAYRFHRGVRRRLEAGLAADLRLYLPHLLNRQDKSTMQRSVETRVPFLDPELVALVLNLPLEIRVEPERKAVLRTIASELLPPEVVTRPKVGFGFDTKRYLTDHTRPEFLAEGMLRDLFEVPQEAWGACVEGLGHPDALRFWTGEIWCRLLLDGQPEGVVSGELWR
jgi:asparagine synthase (glutamine-hydrolysing)